MLVSNKKQVKSIYQKCFLFVRCQKYQLKLGKADILVVLCYMVSIRLFRDIFPGRYIVSTNCSHCALIPSTHGEFQSKLNINRVFCLQTLLLLSLANKLLARGFGQMREEKTQITKRIPESLVGLIFFKMEQGIILTFFH